MLASGRYVVKGVLVLSRWEIEKISTDGNDLAEVVDG